MTSNVEMAFSALIHILAETEPVETHRAEGGGEMKLYRGPYRKGEFNGAFILFAPTGDWSGELKWLYTCELEEAEEHFDVYYDSPEVHDWDVTVEWMPECA